MFKDDLYGLMFTIFVYFHVCCLTVNRTAGALYLWTIYVLSDFAAFNIWKAWPEPFVFFNASSSLPLEIAHTYYFISTIFCITVALKVLNAIENPVICIFNPLIIREFLWIVFIIFCVVISNSLFSAALYCLYILLYSPS